MRVRRVRTSVGGASHGGSEINTTPLIDVVMCLIVFYLIVGKLASGQLAEVDLPDAISGEQDTPSELFIVNIRAPSETARAWRASNAAVIIEGDPVPSPDALTRIVRDRVASKPETQVQLRASRRLPFGEVDPVLRACTEAGVTNITLAANDAGAVSPLAPPMGGP